MTPTEPHPILRHPIPIPFPGPSPGSGPGPSHQKPIRRRDHTGPAVQESLLPSPPPPRRRTVMIVLFQHITVMWPETSDGVACPLRCPLHAHTARRSTAALAERRRHDSIHRQFPAAAHSAPLRGRAGGPPPRCLPSVSRSPGRSSAAADRSGWRSASRRRVRSSCAWSGGGRRSRWPDPCQHRARSPPAVRPPARTAG